MSHTYGLPRLPAASRLHGVLSAALPPQPTRHIEDDVWWSAEFLGLDRSRLFQGLTADGRRSVLREVSRSLVTEAWLVEQAGLLFTSRMVALAATHEERVLYATFGADEARHLHSLSPWVAGAPEPTPFHQLLAEIIETASRPVLVLLIQVLLEGWGLRHYRDLARASLDPVLSAALEAILADEAHHHASGALLVLERPPSEEVIEEALPWASRLLDMVRVGPMGVVDAMERVGGVLSTRERAQLLSDLDADAHVVARLDLLRSLLRPAGALVARLDAAGLFSPPRAP